MLVSAAVISILGVMLGPAQAQAPRQLPDIGSSAAELLGPAQQREFGRMMQAQLRHYEMTLEDPLLNAWLQTVGDRLVAASDKPRQSFTFFWMKDRQINAFATLGGYIGVNAGLVLAAENEAQVASVLAHEIAHVTQQHLLRAIEQAKKDSVPILLAMLGVIAAAQAAGGASSDNASMAALASAQGLMAQRQINYTRSGETEADRIGIRTLANAGYDPNGAAQMFERMQATFRSNQGGARERAPDYLQTHPVTTSRIAEAKALAARHTNSGASSSTGSNGTVPRTGSGNPLLPAKLRIDHALRTGDSGQFAWARERLRVLSANTPAAAIGEYERIRRKTTLGAAQRYGLGLARLLAGDARQALAELEPLYESAPDNLWLGLAMAQAEARAGKRQAAEARLDKLLERLPNNRAIVLTYANLLAERDTPQAGKRAQTLLRPLLGSAGSDPVFQSTYGRVNEIAGDPIRAGEAYAEAAYLNGRPERALAQLNTLKKRPDLDYYARARIDARIAAITPTVLELQRQGIRDPDLQRRQ